MSLPEAAAATALSGGGITATVTQAEQSACCPRKKTCEGSATLRCCLGKGESPDHGLHVCQGWSARGIRL